MHVLGDLCDVSLLCSIGQYCMDLDSKRTENILNRKTEYEQRMDTITVKFYPFTREQ